MTTLTVTGALRLRNAREHRALKGLWSWCNELRNALCEQHLSVKAYNRRASLRHATQWEPGGIASVLDRPHSGCRDRLPTEPPVNGHEQWIPRQPDTRSTMRNATRDQ